MHGLTPYTYLPHDIDIIVLDGGNPLYNADELLNLFEHYCGSKGPIYEDGTRTFVFYVGNNNVEVNAFLHGDALFAPYNYEVMLVGEHKIKVRDALCILKEKYKLHRLKDYQFNIDLQNIMNGLLSEDAELNMLSEKEIFNVTSLVDRINMSLDYYYEREFNDDLSS